MEGKLDSIYHEEARVAQGKCCSAYSFQRVVEVVFCSMDHFHKESETEEAQQKENGKFIVLDGVTVYKFHNW